MAAACGIGEGSLGGEGTSEASEGPSPLEEAEEDGALS